MTSSKRPLTDHARLATAAADTLHPSIDPDLALRLRTLGSRVRKSVTEGYRTQSAFQKSYSTGNIFRSASDTLRDVYDAPHSTLPVTNSTKKRARTQSDQGYHSDGSASPEDNPLDQDHALMSASADRPVKALRKPRTTMSMTHSLPDGSLLLGSGGHNGNATMNSWEEEDWSMPSDQTLPLQQPSPSRCEPTVVFL